MRGEIIEDRKNLKCEVRIRVNEECSSCRGIIGSWLSEGTQETKKSSYMVEVVHQEKKALK